MGQTTEQQVRLLQEKLESIKAEDIMTRDVVSVKEDLRLSQIADFMITKRISGLPVTDVQDNLIGVITATDLFTLLDIVKTGAIKDEAINPRVAFAMSTEIVSITKDTSLNEIMDIMKGRNAHTLPVCENNKLIGIVGRRDVLKHFYQATETVSQGA